MGDVLLCRRCVTVWAMCYCVGDVTVGDVLLCRRCVTV